MTSTPMSSDRRRTGRVATLLAGLLGSVALGLAGAIPAQALEVVSWSPAGTLVDGEEYTVSLDDLDPSTPYMLALCTFDFGASPACDLSEYVSFTTGSSQTSASVDIAVFQEFTSTHAGSAVDVECLGTSGQQCGLVLVDHSDYSYDWAPASF